ncbi:transposase [Streptomyces sp. NPDC003667]
MTNAQREWLESLLPVSNGRCGRRWRDHRQVVNGVLYRIRPGVQWRDLPEQDGPWKRCTSGIAAGQRMERGKCSSSGSRPRRTKSTRSTTTSRSTRHPCARTTTPLAPSRLRRPLSKGASSGRSKPLGSGRN